MHNNDIKFGIRAYDSRGGKQNEVDLKKVSSTDGDENGFIECQPNHKCEYFFFVGVLNLINIEVFPVARKQSYGEISRIT